LRVAGVRFDFGEYGQEGFDVFEVEELVVERAEAVGERRSRGLGFGSSFARSILRFSTRYLPG